MPKFHIDAEISEGQCVVIINADSEEQALERARNGDYDSVESNGWDVGELDESSIWQEPDDA